MVNVTREAHLFDFDKVDQSINQDACMSMVSFMTPIIDIWKCFKSHVI